VLVADQEDSRTQYLLRNPGSAWDSLLSCTVLLPLLVDVSWVCWRRREAWSDSIYCDISKKLNAPM